MSKPVRVGAVSYLNTRPLVFGLNESVDLSYDVPSVLADRLSAGGLDIALLPIIELARIPDLEIVPGLGIVTEGASRSVLLVAARPLDQVRRVALDPESRTSNALIQVLFHDVWGFKPEFVKGTFSSVDDALHENDAVVRIGDKALFEQAPENCEVHDLGTVWTRATGLPFVFAVWAARPGVVDRELYRLLHDSRRRGSQVLDLISRDYEWNGHRDPKLAANYLERNILFRLGGREVEAMRRFFAAASELGLIESPPRLRMALERQTACHDRTVQCPSIT